MHRNVFSNHEIILNDNKTRRIKTDQSPFAQNAVSNEQSRQKAPLKNKVIQRTFYKRRRRALRTATQGRIETIEKILKEQSVVLLENC